MRNILYLLFALGLVLKLLHLPYHTIFLLVIVLLLIAEALNGLIRSKLGRTHALVRLALSFWLLHAIALLKLFPFRGGTLVLASLAALIAVLLSLRTEDRSLPALAPLLLVVLSVLLMQATPTAVRYHFTNLRFSMERSTDAGSWDKYSFLLHREGEHASALAASDSARTAAQRIGRTDWLHVLERHRSDIEQGTWERYAPLPH